MTSSRTLSKSFSEFEQEAFRLETLDDYSRSGSVDAYHAFLAGQEQPEEFKSSDWVTTVRNATRAGRRVYRVHIVSRPLTDYLRFEFGWGYQRNMAVGEEFFILDITEQENPIPEAPDFWLFDNQVISAMNYDGNGKFLGAEFLGADRLTDFKTYRDTALAHAEPFPQWWSKHGE
ncbi:MULTISPECIES: DUF6879 family protein [Streptomyces]|uniref:DUF6879 domain-containing protein n=1 Tax=Streptomyces silvisoli TaxID=3034235 RepID=A0ABT5ZV99_9ACTN|nr:MULTISPECIES: DUF6879 family protein [Streptomyces]MDF3293750.1 hypothetical protein [Streptomyces silvisoli]